ncbi:MAG: outer membrane lipoprotein carrier protein LolA [Vicingaceae bacterium]
MNKVLLGIFLVLTTFVLSAQNKIPIKNPSELKAKLKQQAKKTSSIIADFKQEKHLIFMKNPQLSEGVFYYEQADKLRWEQNTPFNYVLLINNTDIRIKDNGKEKKIAGASKMMGKMNTLMIGMINGDIFDSKQFDVKYFNDGKFYIVELTPKNKRLKAIFNRIELSFLKATTRLKELTFLEKNGDKSVMKFYNEQFNQAIPKSTFLKL